MTDDPNATKTEATATDIAIISEPDAVFSNRIFATPYDSGLRLTFGEQADLSAPLLARSSVFLSQTTINGLYALLSNYVKKVGQPQPAAVPPKVKRTARQIKARRTR